VSDGVENSDKERLFGVNAEWWLSNKKALWATKGRISQVFPVVKGPQSISIIGPEVDLDALVVVTSPRC